MRPTRGQTSNVPIHISLEFGNSTIPLEYWKRVAHLRLHAAATFETRKTIFHSKGTPMGIRSSISAFVVVVFVAGCSSEGPPVSDSASPETFAMAEFSAFQPNAQASESAVADNAAVVLQQPVRVNGQNVDRPVAAVVGEPAALQKRKIIFNATIALRVDDLDEAFDQLFRLVEQSGGYISSSSAHGNAGSARSSEWTMRIPGGRFSGFTKSVAGLGEVVTNAMTSQEVTAEFHDLEARIRNKQQEEKRLQDYLDNSTAKLEDILKVEKEITRKRDHSRAGRSRVHAGANASAGRLDLTIDGDGPHVGSCGLRATTSSQRTSIW